MLNFGSLPRSQQILLGLGAVAIGTLLVLALTNLSSQVGTNLTAGTLMDEALEGTAEDPSSGLPPVDPASAIAQPLTETPEEETGSEDPGIERVLRGVSHVTYIHQFNGCCELRYGTNGNGNWRVETAASDAYVSNRLANSMAVGSDGSIHVAYLGRDQTTVRYVTNRGGSWTSVVIEPGPSNFAGPSLVLDQNGYAHVTYGDVTAGRIKYVTNVSGGWVRETVAESRHARASLALDTRGVPHVSYTGFDSLRYATKVAGSWRSEVVDTEGAGSEFHDIEVDGQGFVHIAYSFYVPPRELLKYATNRSGTWNRETVATGVSGEYDYPALALDSSGRAHIAFLDGLTPEGNRILYAENVSGSWTIQPATARGHYSDLSIDIGQPRSIYISFIKELRAWHTTNASGSWIPTQVSPDNASNFSGTSIRVRPPTKTLRIRP